jgi:hypothetical protein
MPEVRMQCDALRRILEMAYRYAWGADGDADKRDEFRAIYEPLEPLTGRLHNGESGFYWDEPNA